MCCCLLLFSHRYLTTSRSRDVFHSTRSPSEQFFWNATSHILPCYCWPALSVRVLYNTYLLIWLLFLFFRFFSSTPSLFCSWNHTITWLPWDCSVPAQIARNNDYDDEVARNDSLSLLMPISYPSFFSNEWRYPRNNHNSSSRVKKVSRYNERWWVMTVDHQGGHSRDEKEEPHQHYGFELKETGRMKKDRASEWRKITKTRWSIIHSPSIHRLWGRAIN